MTRPRFWVVGLGVAAGLACLAAAYTTFWAARTVTDEYAATFDANLTQSQPLAAKIVLADPALREMMLAKTSAAYRAGGWNAASDMFWFIMHSEVAAYADDETTLACAEQRRAVLRTLLAQPALCRQWLERPRAPEVNAATRGRAPACDAAMLSGAARRRSYPEPDILNDAAWTGVVKGRLEGPVPLNAAERAALSTPGSDDGAFCQAAQVAEANIAALPREVVARYRRSIERGAARATVQVRPDVPMVPPPDLRCPASGTVFTASMVATDGRPVQWTSLGQAGWDCRMISSVNGERGLWNGGDVGSPLRLLWPIEVGKSAVEAQVAVNGTADSEAWRVVSYDSYVLPWGRVGAFAIEMEVTKGDDTRYVVTHYWSPELGFKIGQRARAITGTLPRTTAPDWQLVAFDAGAPPRK